MMRSHHFLLSAPQGLNSIRIPAKGAMQLLHTLLVLSVCLFPNLAAATTPHIYDVPNAGPPGSQTRTVGNGFSPNATLDVYWDSTDVGLIDTDKDGSFGMVLRAPTIRQNGLAIQIPKDAIPGQHWITAVERITQLQAQVPFTVWGVDWPQFQVDAQHTGFNPYENVLNPGTVGSLTAHWKYNGAIFYQPVVVNGIIYVGKGYDGLYALDANTGALRWRHQSDVVTGPAAVANGMVYGGYNSTYALDASTGVLVWNSPVSGIVTAVANGMLYVANYSGFYALDVFTGAVVWNYDDATGAMSSAVANGVVYASGQGKTYALDASTGALIWKAQVSGSSTTLANGMIYLTADNGTVHALDASTGALRWSYPTGYALGTSTAVAKGLIYVGCYDGNVYSLNASTGTLVWKYATGGVVGTAPVVANGVVYFGSQDQNFYALNAVTGELLWKHTTGWVYAASPAVVNGVLYVGAYTDANHGNLYAFGLPNQQMSDKFSPPERPDPMQLTPDWFPAKPRRDGH
jgi:outer membrane protein assembly factor BamB